MKVKPLGCKILIKVDAPETKTKSGIIIPEVAQEKVNYATIIEVGPGTDKEPITVKAGQHIMYDKYAGVDIKVEGIDHLIINQKDILCIIED